MKPGSRRRDGSVPVCHPAVERVTGMGQGDQDIDVEQVPYGKLWEISQSRPNIGGRDDDVRGRFRDHEIRLGIPHELRPFH
ncbi:MAG TPA: hypothetical protein PLX89_18400 [Verrucomicrobiota bacterium]|nr:hypothetical protein [Verrucomicrobiota bacterium]